MFILVIAMKATEPSDLGPKTLKPWAKVTLSSFKVVFCLGHFITATESSPCGDQRFSGEGVSSRSWSTKGLWRRNWAPAPSAFFDALSGSSCVLSHHWLKVRGPTGMTGSWKTLGQNESRFFISWFSQEFCHARRLTSPVCEWHSRKRKGPWRKVSQRPWPFSLWVNQTWTQRSKA